MIAGLIFGLAAVAACYTIAWCISFADRQSDIADDLAYGDVAHLPPVLVHRDHGDEA